MIRFAVALATLPLLSCCSEAAETHPGQDEVVMASSYPVAYLAQRLGADDIRVSCPIPDDGDPAAWRPDREQLAEFQRAGLIVINGAGFEAWVQTASLPDSRMVNASQPFESDFQTYEDVSHSHGPAGNHSHSGVDGHTWMDPILAKSMAGAIRDAMKARWPEHASDIEQRFEDLAIDLDALNARLVGVSETLGERCIITNHPAYNYLVARHGWRLSNLDLDPEDELTMDNLRAIEDSIEGEVGPILLWEAPPLPSVKSALNMDYGITSVVYTPAEVHTSTHEKRGEDWLKLQNDNVDRLERAAKQ
jgi:zinc transport system substrate-binding protein